MKSNIVSALSILVVLLSILGCVEVQQSVEEPTQEPVIETSEPVIIEEKQQITVTPVDEDTSVIITKPEDELEPEANITTPDNETVEEYTLSQEEIEKLENHKLGEERSVIVSGFKKMKLGETYVFGIKVRNVHHYDSNFSLRLESYTTEQKEGMSFSELHYSKNVERWFKNDEFKNFKVEKNSEVLIPIAIEVGSTLKPEEPVREGTRVTYNFELVTVDENSKPIETYSYETIVIRVV